MQSIRKIFTALASMSLAVSSIALFALMLLTFCDVLLRSIFNAPIEAATELTRLAMGVVVFSALPVLSARDGHIAVDLLDFVFNRYGIARIRTSLISISCGLVLWYPANRVMQLAERARSFGDRTEYLGISTFYITWFIAIMLFLTSIILVSRGVLMLFFSNARKETPDV